MHHDSSRAREASPWEELVQGRASLGAGKEAAAGRACSMQTSSYFLWSPDWDVSQGYLSYKLICTFAINLDFTPKCCSLWWVGVGRSQPGCFWPRQADPGAVGRDDEGIIAVRLHGRIVRRDDHHQAPAPCRLQRQRESEGCEVSVSWCGPVIS